MGDYTPYKYMIILADSSTYLYRLLSQASSIKYITDECNAACFDSAFIQLLTIRFVVGIP